MKKQRRFLLVAADNETGNNNNNPRPSSRDGQQNETVYTYNYRYFPAASEVSKVDSCVWLMFFVLILFFVAAFFIIWFVPWPNSSASSRFPDTGPVVHTGSAGVTLPGLGNVQEERTDQGSCAAAWERYNSTTRLCQPRLIFPVGVDSELFDRSSNMCSSFYKNACGRWIDYNAPPKTTRRADRTFGYLQQLNRYLVNHIIDQSTSADATFQFYHSCVDALVYQRQQAQSANYRNHLLQTLRDPLTDISRLPVVFARLISGGFVAPITLSIEKHPMHLRMIPLFGTDGFNASLLTKKSVAQAFRSLYGTNNENLINKKTEDFMTLNDAIEMHRPDPSEMGSSLREYVSYLEGPNIHKDFVYVQDVHRIMRSPRFDLDAFYRELGTAVPDFPAYGSAWIRTSAFYRWFFGSFGPLRPQALEQWRAYIEYGIVYATTHFFPELPQNVFIRAKTPEESPQTETTTTTMGIYNKRRDVEIGVTDADCRRATEEFLPGHIGKRFTSLVVNKALYARVREIASKIRDQMKTLIRRAGQHWMTPHDVEMSLKKLDHLIIRIGEPDEWDQETFLAGQLRADSYLRNLDVIRRFRVQRQWRRWGKTDRNVIQDFGAPLSVVNAMYSPITNTISVYAGLLQHPFVHERYDNATMYATIGMILAHEMAHAFGPYGRRFNYEGSFKAGRMGWWDRSTVTKYDEQLLCIMNAYGTSENTHSCPSFPNSTEVGNLYGQMTLTETVADVMGLRAAYEAYWNASAAASAAPVGAGAEAKKMWMYSFAQMWCSVSSPEYTCKQMTGDVHPIASVRVDGALKMLEYFDELWNCPMGTPMRNDNDEKCRIF